MLFMVHILVVSYNCKSEKQCKQKTSGLYHHHSNIIMFNNSWPHPLLEKGLYLSILEGATTPAAEFIRTLGTPEVHAAAPSQVIAHVTSRTL